MASPQQYSTNLNLASLPEVDQKQNPQLYSESLKLRNALRNLQGALDSYTGSTTEDPAFWDQIPPNSTVRVSGITKIYALGGVAITVGQLVYFTNVSGILTAELAICSASATSAVAFCSVGDGISIGQYGEFILLGLLPYYTGLTPGTKYYCSNTVSGGITNAATIQPIGTALSDKTIWFNPLLLA